MSTTSAPRLIIIDDVDPNIQYTGPWYPDQGSRDSVGNYGPSYQSTLHGVNSNASFSYAFNGTQILVIGSNNILNSSGVLDPTWDCFVDGISISPTKPFAFPENNWVFCIHLGLNDGPHMLTVNATVLQNQTFWFDNIQYLPSADVSLNEAAIIVDNLDSQLQFGAGWEALGDGANMTATAGSTFTFDFTGVSLSWYGYIPAEFPLTASSATYSIDGQTPINFPLKGLPPNSTTAVYNQKFFQTAQLLPASHTLKVVYEGNSNSTPLTLDYLIVQNGTLLSPTSSISSLPTSTGNTVSATSSVSVGPIVGGVMGGVALVVIALLGFFLFRRRQKRHAQEKVFTSTPRPFGYALLDLSSPTPTANPSSSGFSYSRVPQSSQPGVTYGGKGQVSYLSMPSVTNADGIEPLSPSSGVTAYPTNLHAIPFQELGLNLANLSSPSSSSPPAPTSSSSAQPVPLPKKTVRKSEAPVTLGPQRRGNPSVPSSVRSDDTWLSNPNVVLHADSGIRMPASTSVVDIPPLYTPE